MIPLLQAVATAPDYGSGWFGQLMGWVTSLSAAIGPVGAGIASALDSFLPLPSEVILPLIGVAISGGAFGVPWLGLLWAIVATSIGSVVGALGWYGLGAWLGLRRLRAIVDRIPLMDAEDVDKAADWFARYGGRTVFIGRFLPVMRLFISLPAGVARMPLWRYCLFTLFGSAVWNTVLLVAGFFLGQAWPAIEPYSKWFEYLVILTVVVVLVVFIVRRIRARRRERATEDSVA